MKKEKITKELTSDNTKQFKKLFEEICYSDGRHSYDVWSDLMYLFASTIQNTITSKIKDFNEEYKKVWDKREERYIQTINKYKKESQNKIAVMFSLLVEEYQRQMDYGANNLDVLGTLYMNLGISNNNTGQFFTPYDICVCMAQMTLTKPVIKKAVKKNGFITIDDCACGGGATLLASVDCARKFFNRLNWQNHIFVEAQDVDSVCAYMCYIQLSLFPVAGRVVIGNTLSEPVVTDMNRIWYTPLYYSQVWQTREFIKNMRFL